MHMMSLKKVPCEMSLIDFMIKNDSAFLLDMMQEIQKAKIIYSHAK